MPYGLSKNEFKDAASEITQILSQVASQRGMITYSELRLKCGRPFIST